MLSFNKESSSSCLIDDKMQKQVEFEIDSSDLFIQQLSIDAPESTYENNPKEEQHFIGKNRPKRDIRLPQRYVDLIPYVLSVAEETNGVDKPTTYSEAVSCDGSVK